MTQHTPGPWETSDESMKEFPIFRTYDGPIHCVAVCFNKEDAALTAVAPELLAVLKKVQAFWNNDNPNDCCPYQEVDAIINKATGIS